MNGAIEVAARTRIEVRHGKAARTLVPPMDTRGLTIANDEIHSAHLMIIVAGLDKLYDYEALVILRALVLHLTR